MWQHSFSINQFGVNRRSPSPSFNSGDVLSPVTSTFVGIKPAPLRNWKAENESMKVYLDERTSGIAMDPHSVTEFFAHQPFAKHDPNLDRSRTRNYIISGGVIINLPTT